MTSYSRLWRVAGRCSHVTSSPALVFTSCLQGARRGLNAPVRPSLRKRWPFSLIHMAGWKSKPGCLLKPQLSTSCSLLPCPNTQVLIRSFRPGREARGLTWTLSVRFFLHLSSVIGREVVGRRLRGTWWWLRQVYFIAHCVHTSMAEDLREKRGAR